MRRPTVKGMDRETVDETSRSPTAASKGRFSGFARATIFLTDAAELFGSSPLPERKEGSRERIDAR